MGHVFHRLRARASRRSRAREMHRRLAELDRLDRSLGLGAMPTAASPRRRTRRSRRNHGPVLPSLLITVIVLTGILLVSPNASGDRLRDLVGLGDGRLLDRVEAPADDGAYRFLRLQRGGDEPVSYDPCREIEYAVNPAGAPAGYASLVEASVAEVSRATGFRFSSAGTTDDRPFADRRSATFRPSPVVIGWATPEEEPRLAGDVAGVGGSTAIERSPGHQRFITGAIALDHDLFASLAAREADDRARAILMHELGHVVGLDHVSDRSQLMYAENTGRTTFGSGDLAGLARLGAVDCR